MSRAKGQGPARLEDIKHENIVVPVEEQTTLRVSKALHRKIALMADHDGRTMIDLVESVLGNYAERWEKVTGKSLSETRVKGPAV